jgi:O-antigen/teichoic acid export membrane protein
MRAVARNAGSAYAERVLLILSTLLLTPVLFRGLGPSGFGTWSVLFALTTIFAMLETGFGAGLTAYVAEHRAGGRRRELDEALRSGLALMCGFGIAALALSALLGIAGSSIAPEGERDGFRLGMLLLGVAMFIRFPCSAYGSALAGHQRYDLFNASAMLTTVVFAVGAVVAVVVDAGVLGVAAAWSLALVAGGLAQVVFLRRVDPAAPMRPRRAGGGARGLASFSSFSLLSDAMMFLGLRSDALIVGAIRGAAAAAPVGAAAKLQSGLQALTMPFIRLLLPMASDLRARGRTDELARRYTLVTRLTLQVTLPAAVATAVFAPDIVAVWLGPTAPPVTATIVAILALQTIWLAAAPADKVLLGLGRPRTLSIINGCEGLAHLVLTVVLVSVVGVEGAALGTLIASTALGPVKFPLTCRALGRPTLPFLRASIGRAVVSSLPALAAVAAVAILVEGHALRAGMGLAVAFALASVVGGRQLRSAGLGPLRPAVLRSAAAS